MCGVGLLIVPLVHVTVASEEWKKTGVTLSTLSGAIHAYWQLTGRVPSTDPRELLAELSSPAGNQPLIDRRAMFGQSPVPVDAWGWPIRVKIDADKKVVEVSSCGRDGVDNGGGFDDIVLVWSNSVLCK